STFVRDGPPPVAALDPTEVSSDTTAAMPDTDRYVTQSAVSSDAATATMRAASVWANVLTARSNAAFQKDPVNVGAPTGRGRTGWCSPACRTPREARRAGSPGQG